MKNDFKVICKADGNNWERSKPRTELVVKKRFFGLSKTTELKSVKDKVPGPVKDEVCIVTNTHTDSEGTFYTLAGYPYGGYDSRYFIRLDEFTETQKEIAKKTAPISN